MADTQTGKQDHRSTVNFWLSALQVRLRMFGLLVALATFFAVWPWMSAAWDRWLGKWQHSHEDPAVSSGTEFFCPMDPGVVSTWPAICPICHMDLIRRKKSDAQLLPEGVVARMQLSPYKLTLAGVRTVEVTKVESDTEANASSKTSAVTANRKQMCFACRARPSFIMSNNPAFTLNRWQACSTQYQWRSAAEPIKRSWSLAS